MGVKLKQPDGPCSYDTFLFSVYHLACRCIGSVPSTVVVCMKAGETGFEGPEHDFKPTNAPDECLYFQADPFFGYP